MKQWDDESEVVVVGYGGAGAVAAITAYDAGAKVLILEKQNCDTLTRTMHTPNTRMSGGGWLSSVDSEKTIAYLEGMVKISNEPLDAERREIIFVFSQYLKENTKWMKSIVVKTPSDRGAAAIHNVQFCPASLTADYEDLPGADATLTDMAIVDEKYRYGAGMWKILENAIHSKKIPILWGTPALHLIAESGEVRGVIAKRKGKEIRIRASRAVVLTCGGFEFNEWMKQNYLRAYPTYFTGNSGNTGDGITMAMEIGASLWNMNYASWRAVMKFPEYASSFATQLHETASIFIDKRGNRFTNERYKMHSFGYELTNYDCYAKSYPKIPFYWIFDEKRRVMAALANNRSGINAPPGGVMGDIYYKWDENNKKEIDRDWIMKASTLEGLTGLIQKDQDNNRLLDSSALQITIKRYNQFCHKGEDQDFHKAPEFLQPLEDPPYYAVKLWPGGPNTQGGPQRNARAQILRVDKAPIPRLYAAGELGSVWRMLYQGGGNLAECIAFGRIAGTNAAAEKV